jgi:hypothetical protein
MNDERDPNLERLFAAADRELADETFVAGVMAKTGGWRTRSALVLVVCLLAVPAALLVAGPVNETLRWLMQLIEEPLVADAGSGIASRIVLPINSVGAAVVLGVLAVRAIARRLLGARR